MKDDPNLAAGRRLGGDSESLLLVHALRDERALTAAELAKLTGLAAPAVAARLEHLAGAGLVQVVRQGRHRYHRLRTAAAARALVVGMPDASSAAVSRGPIVTGPRNAALRAARTCYGHLAGRLGVAIADALVARGHVELSLDAAEVQESGKVLLGRIGLDVTAFASARARTGSGVCRPCLDWSERRPHLGGTVGAMLCTHAFERGWIRRQPGTRAVTVTPAGRRAFGKALGVRFPL